MAEPRAAGNSGRLLPMELSLAVESALKRLNEDQREAVLLKVYQGFKFEEMAEILDCSGLYRKIAPVHGAGSAENGLGARCPGAR